MSYTLPEPVQIYKHESGHVIRGYKAQHLQAAYEAGRASRDAEIEALNLQIQVAERARDRRDEIIEILTQTVDQLRLEAEVVEALGADAERYRWMAKRDRWASCLIDFDRTSTYDKHRVVWFTDDGWHEAQGQSFEEAIDAARKEGL